MHEVGGLWTGLQEKIRELFKGVNATVADANRLIQGQVTPQFLPGGVSIWAGFEAMGSPGGKKLLRDCYEAGARRVIFTPTNDAARPTWAWQPRRQILLDGMAAAADQGYEVVAGPWVRGNVDFMRTCGQRLRELFDDLQLEPLVEWDAEGSYEVTMRRLVRHYGGNWSAATDAIVQAFLEAFTDDVTLSATLLYFNRPAGDALLRHPLVRKAIIQVYSVILGGKKFAATSAPNFQPGTLQERGWANYDDFLESHDLDALGQGLGWWAQERDKLPVALQMSRADAFRKASDVTLQYAHEACGWAAHLWKEKTWRGRTYRELVLEEIRYLASGGLYQSQEDAAEVAHFAPVPEAIKASVPQGVTVDWSQRQVLTGGREPEGWRRLDRDDDPMGLIQKTASAIRRLNHMVVRPLPRAANNSDVGTYTPFKTTDGDRYLALDERHAATFRRGKRVTAAQIGKPGGIHGITVLEHVDNQRSPA